MPRGGEPNRLSLGPTWRGLTGTSVQGCSPPAHTRLSFSGALRSWPISTCTTPFTSFPQLPPPACCQEAFLSAPPLSVCTDKSPEIAHRPCPLCAPAAAFPPKCHRTPGSSTPTGCRGGLDPASFSILFGPISAMKQKDQRSVRTKTSMEMRQGDSGRSSKRRHHSRREKYQLPQRVQDSDPGGK